MISSARTNPTATTFTRQLSSNFWLKYASPPRLGTPSGLPYCQMPSTTPTAISAERVPAGPAGSPNRSGSSTAKTSPPMQYTSRTMPPIPVAAPSLGTTWLGWLWLSWAKTMP